jgi:Domain of unknown function (DUF4153)
MESQPAPQPKPAFPLILAAAVVQGWCLYGLHLANTEHRWPSTDHAWLYALYAVAVFVPSTLQLLADFVYSTALWIVAAAMGVALFYFGWHYGSHVDADASMAFARDCFPAALELSILWLIVLPFVQIRLATGSWGIEYSSLFSSAWRNKLVLAEAALFTGLFWLLLFLWGSLFHMLKIEFFRELFEKPVFAYPVTSLAFGCAIHLVGSVDRLTAVVLEQLLNVLKWLATLAGAILLLFTIALISKLPGLLFTDEKAIGAVWLLWLAAVMVLLLNAAYRDGRVVQPYPGWVAKALRCVVPFMVVVSLTALYALSIRTKVYGLTVERFWALVVAAMALLYSIGYSTSVLNGCAWLGNIARVNVIGAVVLVAILGASLTPVLSPYRLSADSQYHRIERMGLAALEGGPQYGWESSPLKYLRYGAGGYGLARLENLSKGNTGVDADAIRQAAVKMLAEKNQWESSSEIDVAAQLEKLPIFPAGRVLDKALIDAIKSSRNDSAYRFYFDQPTNKDVGIFIDLNRDGSDEFVLLRPMNGLLFAKDDHGGWVRAGHLVQVRPQASRALSESFLHEMEQGNYKSEPSQWNELSVGGHNFRVNP